MTSAGHHSMMGGGKKKMPYIRNEDGRLAFMLPSAFTGPGQYETGWLGSININGTYQQNAWCGPFGLNVPMSGMQFRWYISKPANELVSVAGSNTQHAFVNAIQDTPLSLLSAVYNDGESSRGWLVRHDDITAGTDRHTELYCEGTLINTIMTNIGTAINNVSSLPIGIMNGLDLSNPSSTSPSSFSPLKSGSRFYRLYVKKNDVLIHDCYPMLDGTEPKVYDAITNTVITKLQGTASYGED